MNNTADRAKYLIAVRGFVAKASLKLLFRGDFFVCVKMLTFKKIATFFFYLKGFEVYMLRSEQ